MATLLNTLSPLANLLSPLLRSSTGGVSSGLPNIFGLSPSTVLGAGSLLGSAAFKEPGEIGEARQFLRNQFTSPRGLTDQFTGQLGALTSGFEPLLRQQETQALNDAQQRIIAGMPSSFSTAMSGPEILSIRNAISRDILPRRQAMLSEFANQLLDRQSRAAGTLLQSNQGNAMAQALGQLGGSLLLRDVFAGGQGGLGLGGAAGGLLGGAGGAASGAAGGGGPGGVGSNVLANLGSFLTSPLGAGISTALGTYGLGNAFAPMLGQNQFQSAGLGALGGTATGAAVGSIIPGLGTAIGAIVGGLAGGVGGLTGEQSAQRQEKAYNRSQDIDSQRDQVLELGNLGVEFAQQFGINPASFQAQVNSLAANVESPADEQGIVAQAIGAMLRQQLGDAGFAQAAPMLRQRMIDYLSRSTFTAPDSRFSGGAPLNLIGAIPSEYQGSWAQLAGF